MARILLISYAATTAMASIVMGKLLLVNRLPLVALATLKLNQLVHNEEYKGQLVDFGQFVTPVYPHYD